MKALPVPSGPYDSEEERLVALGRWLMQSTDDDVYDYGYAGLARCAVCGRALAGADCELELDSPVAQRMCRVGVGDDPTCAPGLRGAAPATVGPWHEAPAA